MKRLNVCLVLLSIVLLSATFANAQRLDASFGIGSTHVSSNGQTVDLTGSGVALPTPDMGGVFGTLGAGLMITPHMGVGGEASFRFAQGDYAGLTYRPIFYDFNGIWTPTAATSRIMPEIQGGFGGVNMRFYGGGAVSCDVFGNCSNFAGSSNHLQLHAGLGIRLYVTKSIFVRPTFDYHWVRNFSEFGSNNVPMFSAAVGYSFGK